MNHHFTVKKGQLTFDAEGSEYRGSYFSRTPHVPSPSSGVTIGRGYDLSQRAPESVVSDLARCGIATSTAEKLARGCGARGGDAQKAVKKLRLSGIEITPEQQKKLFEVTYDALEKDVKRICSKSDVVKTYGKTDWANLSPAVAEVLVDLRYRGDYTPATRKKIQKLVAQNDLKAFHHCLNDEAFWCRLGVPSDRFRRRAQHLEQAMRAFSQSNPVSKPPTSRLKTFGLKIREIRLFLNNLQKKNDSFKKIYRKYCS